VAIAALRGFLRASRLSFLILPKESSPIFDPTQLQMPDTGRNLDTLLEEEAGPQELRAMAYNFIATLVLISTLLFLMVFPFLG
jgi:hypothetical protein